MHIAIIGSGQLARMSALAGIPLGLSFSFLADEHEDTRSIEGLGGVVRVTADQSGSSLYAALGKPDAITVEKEQVDVALLKLLQPHCPVHPCPEAFAACQHRYREKQLLDSLAIPSSSYTFGQSAAEAIKALSQPVVVKSCREGYDGKNQWVLKTAEDAEKFDRQLSENVEDIQDFIIERWVPFDKEVSQVSVRDVNGDIRHYPLTENQHSNGILCKSLAPATAVSDQTIQAAQTNIGRIMQELNYVGVMAMECFLVGESLLVNELAPRVHNSGHWTQSGSKTCQFENHIRAIAGLPLGSTEVYAFAGMYNLNWQQYIAVRRAISLMLKCTGMAKQCALAESSATLILPGPVLRILSSKCKCSMRPNSIICNRI